MTAHGLVLQIIEQVQQGGGIGSWSQIAGQGISEPQTLRNMLENGYISRDGDNIQVTAKGEALARDRSRR